MKTGLEYINGVCWFYKISIGDDKKIGELNPMSFSEYL